MRIAFRQEHGFIRNALQSETWQSAFPEVTTCKYCGCGDANPMLVINDNEGFISLEGKHVPELEPEGFWPHDCLAIALYLCPSCGEITALWNQG
jgi:hypothetical protein